MTEDELRAMVRQLVQERLGAPPKPTGEPHPSHLRLRVLPGVEAGGPCIIEPRVACTLCGYCQSYGH